MSKRGPKTPTPFFKTLPSVIRSFGPRLVIAAAACALLLLCTGGTYILSHQDPAPDAKSPTRPVSDASNDSSEAQVLSDATPQPASNPTPPPTTNPQPVAAAPTDNAETPDAQASTDTARIPAQAPVNVSTSPKQTSVHAQTPASDGLSLNLPLGL